MSLCRYCHQNLEASSCKKNNLSFYWARPKPNMITILGMTRLRRRPVKPEFLGKVWQSWRGATVSVWPLQRSSSSLTETMPLIQGTLSPATPLCAKHMGKTACQQPFPAQTARGNVVFRGKKTIEINASEENNTSCLSSVSTLFWNIHPSSQNNASPKTKPDYFMALSVRVKWLSCVFFEERR